MYDLCNASCHTHIVDESTHVSVTTMLILYAKFFLPSGAIYNTVFAGILQLSTCDSTAITTAIKDFYALNSINIQKMAMFMSDGASVMLGKNNVAAQLWSRCIPFGWTAPCEDLGIEKTWGLMMRVSTSHCWRTWRLYYKLSTLCSATLLWGRRHFQN